MDLNSLGEKNKQTRKKNFNVNHLNTHPRLFSHCCGFSFSDKSFQSRAAAVRQTDTLGSFSMPAFNYYFVFVSAAHRLQWLGGHAPQFLNHLIKGCTSERKKKIKPV